MKTAKSYRLSAQALQALSYLASETGTNETAIIEMSLAYYRKSYNNLKLAQLEDIGHSVSPALIASFKIADPSPKKKRKRH